MYLLPLEPPSPLLSQLYRSSWIVFLPLGLRSLFFFFLEKSSKLRHWRKFENYTESGKNFSEKQKQIPQESHCFTTGWSGQVYPGPVNTPGWMASLTRWTWVWASFGSWWWTRKTCAAVHGVAKSQTRLSDWTELSQQPWSRHQHKMVLRI